jgi:hypothetical protein
MKSSIIATAQRKQDQRQNTKEKIQNNLNFRLWTVFADFLITFLVYFISLCG